MRIADVVNQLRIILPKYSDAFSDLLEYNSASASGGVVTFTTKDSAPHGLSTGDPVVLQSFAVRTPIQQVIPGEDASVSYYIETASDTDLKKGYEQTVTLDGFTDPEWNAEQTLAEVYERRLFGISELLAEPVLTGNEVLLEVRADGINGYYSVTVTGSDTFTVSGDMLDGEYSEGTISASVRIAGAIDIDRAAEQYTKQFPDKVWMFVTPNDVDVSKDMHTYSDATATRMTVDEFRLRMLDGFTVYLVKSTVNEMAAVSALDLFRHDLTLPILKSVCGVKFPPGLTNNTDFKTVLRGHGVASYNRAFLVYAYDFEQPADIVSDDVAYEGDVRAFLDIDYIHRVGGDDTEDATAHVDLDDYRDRLFDVRLALESSTLDDQIWLALEGTEPVVLVLEGEGE